MEFFREIVLAIESYKEDIVNYPIFFSVKSLKYLDTDEALKSISNKLCSDDYQPKKPSTYVVPYDAISTRVANNLEIDDLIIRYIVTNRIKKSIQLYENNINPENFSVYCIIDIHDCYNSIEKEIFIDTIKRHYFNKINEKTLNLLAKTVDFNNSHLDQINPISVGLKPDEYYAELFLSIVHSEINVKISENISRNGDEFLICGVNINALRGIISSLESLFADYGLKINKSKNSVKFQTENRQITRVLPYEEPWPYSSPSCPPPMFPAILFKEKNYTRTIGDNENEKSIGVINSYESSILYLKQITPEIEKIDLLSDKYSSRSLYGHWNSSTPTEEKRLQESIDFGTILNPIVLDKLETIIYRYPRSHYFSHMAIKNVCTYAKNMDYDYDNSCKNNDSNAFVIDSLDLSSYNSETSSFLCEKANSILLNAIRSEDIFDFQKYLIIRELYFDNKNLTIDKANYELKGKIPFPILFANEFDKILNSEWGIELPLLEIVKEIQTKSSETTANK